MADIVYCKDTFIPNTICGQTCYDCSFTDWAIGRVAFKNYNHMHKICGALSKADFKIIKVTKNNIYFEV